MLFMQAARWADDIRANDKQHHRGAWHYINWPFKPEGQPVNVEIKEPEPVNILTALAENERVVEARPIRRSEGPLHYRGCSILSATYTSRYTRCSYSRLTRAKRKGRRNSQGWYYFSQQGYGRELPPL